MPRPLRLALLVSAALGALACDVSAKEVLDENALDENALGEPRTDVHTSARAEVVDAAGLPIGSVDFLTEGGVLRMSIDVTDLEPGRHAIHVHENGDCSGPGFESAGGHFNPTHRGHGLEDEAVDGHHVGDLPNIVANGKGDVGASRILEGATLVDDAPAGSNSLLRKGGTAVVIHAEPDDGRTDPAGSSGARVACGVILPVPRVP